jgi:hypothetical protein
MRFSSKHYQSKLLFSILIVAMSGCCFYLLCPDEFSKNLLYIKYTGFELSDLDSDFVIRYKDKMLEAVDTAFFVQKRLIPLFLFIACLLTEIYICTSRFHS